MWCRLMGVSLLMSMDWAFRADSIIPTGGYEPAGPPWDEYMSDPGTTPEPGLITHIYLPIR